MPDRAAPPTAGAAGKSRQPRGGGNVGEQAVLCRPAAGSEPLADQPQTPCLSDANLTQLAGLALGQCGFAPDDQEK